MRIFIREPEISFREYGIFIRKAEIHFPEVLARFPNAGGSPGRNGVHLPSTQTKGERP